MGLLTVKTKTDVALSVLLPKVRTKPYIYYCLLLHLKKFAFTNTKDPFSCEQKIKMNKALYKKGKFCYCNRTILFYI